LPKCLESYFSGIEIRINIETAVEAVKYRFFPVVLIECMFKKTIV
jgi:hypothetical protein